MGAMEMTDRLTIQVGLHKSEASKAASIVLLAFAEIQGYGPKVPMSVPAANQRNDK